MNQSIKLVKPPTQEPVSLESVKQHLKLETDEDDELLGELITTARELVEDYTHTAILTQSYVLLCEEVDEDYIDLPRPPLQSVETVSTIDDDGVETLLDPSCYRVDDISTPGRVLLKPGCSWPSSTVRVEYTAGYENVEAVPRVLRTVVRMLATYLYENRGEERSDVRFASELGGDMPLDVRMLLEPYTVYLCV